MNEKESKDDPLGTKEGRKQQVTFKQASSGNNIWGDAGDAVLLCFVQEKQWSMSLIDGGAR